MQLVSCCQLSKFSRMVDMSLQTITCCQARHLASLASSRHTWFFKIGSKNSFSEAVVGVHSDHLRPMHQLLCEAAFFHASEEKRLRHICVSSSTDFSQHALSSSNTSRWCELSWSKDTVVSVCKHNCVALLSFVLSSPHCHANFCRCQFCRSVRGYRSGSDVPGICYLQRRACVLLNRHCSPCPTPEILGAVGKGRAFLT